MRTSLTEFSKKAKLVKKSDRYEVYDLTLESLVLSMTVLQDVLKRIDADIVVVLQATSPIRNPDLIDDCIRRFLDTGADSLATGFTCKYQEYGTSGLRRQDIKGFFYDDGSVYITKADLIKNGDRFGRKMERVITDREQNIEIDDELDFWVAEQVLKRRGAK